MDPAPGIRALVRRHFLEAGVVADRFQLIRG